MDQADRELWVGVTVDEALLKLADQGTKSVHLVLCRDRKSIGYPHWRVIASDQGKDGIRLTACSFPQPNQ